MPTFKATPVNIRNGNKAPYFLVESANKHEGQKEAQEEFKTRSALAKYPNWNIDVERI